MNIPITPSTNVSTIASIAQRVSVPGHVPTCLCNRCIQDKRKRMVKAGIKVDTDLLTLRVITIAEYKPTVERKEHAYTPWSKVRYIRPPMPARSKQ